MFSHAPAQSRAQDERKRQSGREERNEGRGIRGEAVPMPGSSLEAQSQGSTSVVRERKFPFASASRGLCCQSVPSVIQRQSSSLWVAHRWPAEDWGQASFHLQVPCWHISISCLDFTHCPEPLSRVLLPSTEEHTPTVISLKTGRWTVPLCMSSSLRLGPEIFKSDNNLLRWDLCTP